MENRKIGLIFLFAVALAFFAGFQIQSFFVDNEPEPFLDVYSEITEALDRYYLYDLEDVEKDQAFIAQMEAIVESYAQANQDPYTRLVANPVNVAPTNDESYVGIGITISNEITQLRVLDVVYDGPSYQKLYPNDLIIGINIDNEPLYFEDLDQDILPTSYLVGVENETKSLIVLNPDGIEETVNITYENILTPTAYQKVINDHVGYIKINEFSSYVKDATEGTAKVFSDALNLLENDLLIDETDTLIIDVRNNPGGALSALHNSEQSGVIPGILQQLLMKDVEQPLFSMMNKNNIETTYLGGLASAKPYQIKILVNERSASAAEVLAAAMSVNGGYELYGMPTFGKDVYQTTQTLTTIDSMTYYLSYTEGYWYYDGDKKVSSSPLDVNQIEQSGFYQIEQLIYEKELSLDDVDMSLVQFQMFLNAYYDLDGEDKVRTDGYFNQQTEDLIGQFQLDNALTQTKDLDIETARLMFDLLKTYQNDLAYDQQFQALLGLI